MRKSLITPLVMIMALLFPIVDTAHAEAGAKAASVEFGVPNIWKDSGSRKVWGNVPRHIRKLARCIRDHESHNNPKAENGGKHGGSTASGAYQFLTGTWQGNARWARLGKEYVARKYARGVASDAPYWVQDVVFLHSIRHGGRHNWQACM